MVGITTILREKQNHAVQINYAQKLPFVHWLESHCFLQKQMKFILFEIFKFHI